MKILFYDGPLTLNTPKDDMFKQALKYSTNGFCAEVDGSEGPTANVYSLQAAQNLYEDDVVLVTNSLVALSHIYGWNKEEGHTDIYLWREKYKDFIRCDKLTLKEIKEAHNIEKMYMSGSFEEEIPELPEHLKGI